MGQTIIAMARLRPVGRKILMLRYDIATKRVLDCALALVLVVLLAPLMFVLAILVRLTSPGPALFRQTRIGQSGQPFQMLKFRTMQVDADDWIHRELNICELMGDRSPPGTRNGVFKLEHDPRITKAGHWLRRYSLDELPQLFNVLRGEMSMVGPRPSLPWEVELYTPEQRRRHDCRPGITGLWQVSGRYSVSMPEMLALDVRYVETWSLALDISILLRTPRAILLAGASGE